MGDFFSIIFEYFYWFYNFCYHVLNSNMRQSSFFPFFLFCSVQFMVVLSSLIPWRNLAIVFKVFFCFLPCLIPLLALASVFHMEDCPPYQTPEADIWRTFVFFFTFKRRTLKSPTFFQFRSPVHGGGACQLVSFTRQWPGGAVAISLGTPNG